MTARGKSMFHQNSQKLVTHGTSSECGEWEFCWLLFIRLNHTWPLNIAVERAYAPALRKSKVLHRKCIHRAWKKVHTIHFQISSWIIRAVLMWPALGLIRESSPDLSNFSHYKFFLKISQFSPKINSDFKTWTSFLETFPTRLYSGSRNMDSSNFPCTWFRELQ